MSLTPASSSPARTAPSLAMDVDRSGTDDDRIRDYPVVKLLRLFLGVRVIEEQIRLPTEVDDPESLSPRCRIQAPTRMSVAPLVSSIPRDRHTSTLADSISPRRHTLVHISRAH